MKLVIATRESQLALVQSEWVAAQLRQHHAGIQVSLSGMTTRGDQILDRPLAQVGGKGLFIKELEVALLAGNADLAVHSCKDVPMTLEPEFAIAFVAPREDPRDAFVSERYASLAAMPAGAKVGTSSLRRVCQLKAKYPTLSFLPVRGNVNTRLAKLERGDYDALVLAAAGLRRLGMGKRIRALIDIDVSVPAIGQGVLAIEYLRTRTDVAQLLAPMTDPALTACTEAERAFGVVLGGSCEIPLAAHATVNGGALSMRGLIGMPDGSRVVSDVIHGDMGSAEALGRTLGERVLAQGGAAIRTTLESA